MLHRAIRIDGRKYEVDIKQNTRASVDAPRIVIAAFQPNTAATSVLRLCINSLQFTTVPHELWVVDNCSPGSSGAWLGEVPGINIVFNRTKPREPGRWIQRLAWGGHDPHAASYANGIALEIGAAVIDPGSRYMVTLHQDTLACHSKWLQYLLGMFDESCRAAGVRLDRTRVPALHILGMAFDFQLFRSLGLAFRHNLPQCDVGDAISVGFEKAGFRLGACRNSHSEPTLLERLPEGSRFRSIHADRALDDQDRVIFMHLGRGTLKSLGTYPPGKTTVEEWLSFGRQLLDIPSDVPPTRIRAE